MADKADRFRAQQQLVRAAAPFVARLDALFAPLRAEMRRHPILMAAAEGRLQVNPFATHLLALTGETTPDHEREAAVRWFRTWLGPAPIHRGRHRQLLGELRRAGFFGSTARRQLEERLLAAIVVAIADETLDAYTIAELESGILRDRVAKEVTVDVGRPLRLDAEIAALLMAGTTQSGAAPPPAAVSAALRKAKLTPRERRVLALMDRGLGDPAIAQREKIARSTVRGLRARATKKLAKTRR